MSIRNFRYWKNEIADIPTLEDGIWVDLETGIAYDENINYDDSEQQTSNYKEKAIRNISLNKAKESRKLANFFGGKALSGTAKQKSWGEAVRQSKLESSSLTDEDKEKLVKIGAFVDTASFWIDNRDVDAKNFTEDKIVEEYNKIMSIKNKNHETLREERLVCKLEAARKEVEDAIKASIFKFKKFSQ